MISRFIGGRMYSFSSEKHYWAFMEKRGWKKPTSEPKAEEPEAEEPEAEEPKTEEPRKKRASRRKKADI